jgi:hypothetical protein
MAVTLEKKLLWESDEPILDVLVAPETLVALTTSHVTWLAASGGQWAPAGRAEIPARPWPRDPRGRIRPSAGGFVASLPGLQCRGAITPPAIECKSSEEPWVIESGSNAMLLAAFALNRNFFDGHIITQTGIRKNVPPFFSAAAAEQDGKPVWLFALVDGRTQITDAALEPLGFVNNQGSDAAGVAARCAGGSQILATRAGDASDSDAIQAFGVSGRGAAPLSGALEFTGPIRALWPAGPTTAVAVAQDSTTGRYAAYLVTVACGA